MSWIVAVMSDKSYEDEVYRVDGYDAADRKYADLVDRVNPKWSGKIFIAEVKKSQEFPLK